MTHTYAVLGVSRASYQEIRDRLAAAGYTDQIDDNGELVDMHGLALAPNEPLPDQAAPSTST